MFYPSGIIEINGKKESQAAASPSLTPQGSVDAAFIHQKTDEIVHRGVIGPADQGRCLTLLRDQPGQDQPMQMVDRVEAAIPSFSCRLPTGNPPSPARTSVR